MKYKFKAGDIITSKLAGATAHSYIILGLTKDKYGPVYVILSNWHDPSIMIGHWNAQNCDTSCRLLK